MRSTTITNMLVDILPYIHTKGDTMDFFTEFFDSQASGYETTLNKLWEQYTKNPTIGFTKYTDNLNMVKSLGFVVYRNSKGVHKVVKDD